MFGGSSIFFGGMWSMDELIEAQKLHQRVPVPLVHHRAALLGPVPGVVFAGGSLSNFIESCINNVRKMPVEGILSALKSNICFPPGHILLLDRDSQGGAVQRLLSPLVAALMLEKARLEGFTGLCGRVNELRDYPWQAASVGNLLEAIFHTGFPVGRVLNGSKVCHHDFYKTMEHFTWKMFCYIQEGGSEAVYFRSLSREEAGIDGIYVDLVNKIVEFYQVTINRKKHGIIKSVAEKWAGMFRHVFGFRVTGVYYVAADEVSYSELERSALCEYKVKFGFSSDAAAMDRAESGRQLLSLRAYVEELKMMHQTQNNVDSNFSLDDHAAKKRRVGKLDPVEKDLLDKATAFIHDVVNGWIIKFVLVAW